VIDAERGEGDLAAHRRQLNDASSALFAKERQSRAHHLDRPDEVGVDLVTNLLVGDLFRRTRQSVAGIVHDDVDLAEIGEGRAHHGANTIGVGDIERPEPKTVAVLLRKVFDRGGFPHGAGDTIAPHQQFFSQRTAEAGGNAGNEPGSGQEGISTVLGLFKPDRNLCRSGVDDGSGATI
jgi:hypothetical protein